jgi:hypothetical protein
MRSLGVAAALVAFGVSTQASAAVNVSTVFDLANATVISTPIGFSVIGSGPSVAPVTVSESAPNNSIDLKMSFAAGQSITVSGLLSVWEYIGAVAGSTPSLVQQSGTLTLLGSGTAGHPADYMLSRTSIDGLVHIGQSFDLLDGSFSSLPPFPASLTFTGLRWQGTIDDYLVPGLAARSYATPGFTVAALAGSVTRVPEPATWAMLVFGFGTIGAALRGSRRPKIAAHA